MSNIGVCIHLYDILLLLLLDWQSCYNRIYSCAITSKTVRILQCHSSVVNTENRNSL